MQQKMEKRNNDVDGKMSQGSRERKAEGSEINPERREERKDAKGRTRDQFGKD